MAPDEKRERTLADWLRQERSLPLGELGPVVDGALRVLHELHERKIVHRTITPAAIVIGPAHHIELLDTAPPVSKVRTSAGRRSEPSLEAFDATLGTPFAYMAPEQVRGLARVDERADLYALGAVAFRALTGRLPFEGSNALTLIALKLDRDAPRLHDVTKQSWPAPLESFVMRSLARSPEHRFANTLTALAAWRGLFN